MQSKPKPALYIISSNEELSCFKRQCSKTFDNTGLIAIPLTSSQDIFDFTILDFCYRNNVTAFETTSDIITGCAVAQHCSVVTMTSKVNGKTGTLTPCRSETPENFITKIGHIDYIAGGNTQAKFYVNRPRGVRPTNSQNITSCDFVYLSFPSLFFPSLSFFSCRRL